MENLNVMLKKHIKSALNPYFKNVFKRMFLDSSVLSDSYTLYRCLVFFCFFFC